MAWLRFMASFQRRLRTLRHRSISEQWLALWVAVLVLAVRLGLWLLPFRVVRSLLARISHVHGARYPTSGDMVQLSRLVSSVSVSIPQASCLTQALALQTLLRRRGVSPALRLGVGRDAKGKFIAHAWLEHEGRVLIGGGGLEQFVALPDLERQPTRR